MMNDLSVFIYLASVIPTLAGWIVAFSVILFIAILLSEIVRQVWSSDIYSWESEPVRNRKLKAQSDGFTFPKKYAVFCFLAITISTLIPSKETLYLIAGSEAASAVASSEFGEEVLSDIKQVIRNQLQGLK